MVKQGSFKHINSNDFVLSNPLPSYKFLIKIYHSTQLDYIINSYNLKHVLDTYNFHYNFLTSWWNYIQFTTH